MPDSPIPDSPPPSPDWWRNVNSVLEVLALACIAIAVFIELGKGKLDLNSAVPILIGGLVTVTSMFSKKVSDTK